MKNRSIDVIITVVLAINFSLLAVLMYNITKDDKKHLEIENKEQSEKETKEEIKEKEIIIEPKVYLIEITTAGDCTLGTDSNFGYKNEFDWYFKEKVKEDYSYYFAKVKYLFDNDDYSYVNLEGTLTTYNKKTKKKYNFKGNPKYTNILTEGSIEGVNIANNHSNDYSDQGYRDTKKYLTEAGIDYFGHDSVLIKEIKGKKIAFVGYTGVGLWIDNDKEMAKTNKKLKEEDHVDIVIANFHWGIEYSHTMTDVQRKRAHLAIDSGADIVIGSHPHCLQGMELYKDKYIVYSLGNFIFGGNSNPKSIGRECIIVKMYFKYIDDEYQGVQIKVIPCNISSVKSRNNYQPIVVDDKTKKAYIDLMNKYSKNYKYVESEEL